MTFLQEAEALTPRLKQIFYTIHRHPELGNRETQTAALIRRELEQMGIEAIPCAGTGTIGVIHGGTPGPVLGFRADMDALPIQEETDLPYASQVPGVMHACGHDFHVTALLGAAEILYRRREQLPGTVKLFFQPDEEGDGGAERMIQEGCLQQPAVDAVLCCHVESGLPAGQVSLKDGAISAASNPFTVTLRGRGSHGAKPHLGTDVIVAGAQMIAALQTIASRRINPTEPVVVTVGAFHAGTAGNILPEEAVFSGIIRTMSQESREQAVAAFHAIVNGIAAAMGVEAVIRMVDGYPFCQNDPSLTALVRRSAERLLGKENVRTLDAPSLGTDDFGYYCQHVPGCYYYVGVGDGGTYYPNHNPRFIASPTALPVAAALHAQTAWDFLIGGSI